MAYSLQFCLRCCACAWHTEGPMCLSVVLAVSSACVYTGAVCLTDKHTRQCNDARSRVSARHAESQPAIAPACVAIASRTSRLNLSLATHKVCDPLRVRTTTTLLAQPSKRCITGLVTEPDKPSNPPPARGVRCRPSQQLTQCIRCRHVTTRPQRPGACPGLECHQYAC
jgi:hypothetical protein